MGLTKTSFKPGQVTNPAGRKPVDPAIKAEIDRIFHAACPDAARALVDIVKTGKKDSDRIKAAEIILNRSLGMPKQDQELESTINQMGEVTIKIVKSDKTDDA